MRSGGSDVAAPFQRKLPHDRHTLRNATGRTDLNLAGTSQSEASGV